jgi:hypothetical protein
MGISPAWELTYVNIDGLFWFFLTFGAGSHPQKVAKIWILQALLVSVASHGELSQNPMRSRTHLAAFQLLAGFWTEQPAPKVRKNLIEANYSTSQLPYSTSYADRFVHLTSITY